MEKSANKISHTKLAEYQLCSKKYEYRYVKRLRPKYVNSYMIFGSAIDKALNSLLANKDVVEAKKVFHAAMETTVINGETVDCRFSEKVQYSNSDFDADLITLDDEITYQLRFPNAEIFVDYTNILADKKQLGYLQPSATINFNLASWLSLKRKGYIMIDSYAKTVLPTISQVIAVQEPISLKNEEGDELVGFLDLIIKDLNGDVYLMDNKTSAVPYAKDSAGKSTQLVIYFHEAREKYGIKGVGYYVMKKHINKNPLKICNSCGFDGSATRHKTCNKPVNKSGAKSVRCDGSWTTTLRPFCEITTILNDVTKEAEDVVINAFDQANEDIKNNKFVENWDSCYSFGKKCEYFRKCHEGSDEDLVDLNELKKV